MIFAKQLFALAIAFCVFTSLSSVVLAQGASEYTSELASALITVTDADAVPVEGASVEVRRWTNKWNAIDKLGRSNTKGEMKFDGLPPGEYLCVIVRKPGFAPLMQDFSPTSGIEQRITCKLLKPVESWIEIRSPDGKRVQGATIMRLDVESPSNQNTMCMGHEMFSLISAGDHVSDASGRLKLPPLPTGANVKIRVIHPDWTSKSSEELTLETGGLGTIVLGKGSHLAVEFAGDKETLDAIDGQKVAVSLFSRFIKDKAGSVHHSFEVSDGQLKFTVPPGGYESIGFFVDGYIITPQLPSSATRFDYITFNRDEEKRKFVVRKTHKVKGRVVTAEGQPVVGAYVDVNTENLYYDIETGERRVIEKIKTASTDYPTTDKDGYYTASVAKGKGNVQVIWSGYYSEPSQMDVVIGDQATLPDYVVKQMPRIKGRIVDSKHQPVDNAVVRFKSNRNQEFALSRPDGTFEIDLEYFEYDRDLKKRQFDINLLAYNPATDEAKLVSVKVDDESEFENVLLRLEPQDSDWILKTLGNFQDMMADYSEQQRAEFQRRRDVNKDKFSGGSRGNGVPNMSEGTWLNTQASSLDDFRGKYVLLDFWFIGCGPCERDLPSVKAAQTLFAEQGFSVVSVHIPGQGPEQVQQFADAKGMNYPVVVDTADGLIIKQFKQIGVQAYPSYILLGPDGKIVSNDSVGAEHFLRSNKLEIIHSQIQKSKDDKKRIEKK